jgi:hypothetical protein
LATPAPPQVTPVPEHVPQEATVRLALQLSSPVTTPQFLPLLEQKVASSWGVQAGCPQTLATPPPPQLFGDVQVRLRAAAQSATVRLTRQLSGAVTLPQSLVSRVQNALSVSAVHEQTLEAHVFGDAHVTPVAAPQSTPERTVPQLSVPEAPVPQFLPSRWQNDKFDSAVQPQTLAVPPPPQVLGDVQVRLRAAAQSATVRLALQLSSAVTRPQFLLSRVQNAASVSGVQAACPQTLAVPPPPQVFGKEQVRLRAAAQSATVRFVPQLSAAVTLPQFLVSRVQNALSVSAVHVQTLEALHEFGDAQLKPVAAVQSTLVRVALQLSVPVATVPQFVPSRSQYVRFDSEAQPHTLAVPVPPQVTPVPVHVPHEATVRVTPQLSFAVSGPQFLP